MMLLIFFKVQMGDYSSLITYYKNKINEGVVYCMYGLGFHYQFINKDDTEMEKYYFMAIKLGDRDSHINYTSKYKHNHLKLGEYYQYIKVDETLMIEHYLLAIHEGNIIAMNKLGYYFYLAGNYTEMKMLYEMAAEKGHIESINELGYFYERMKNYNKMEYYYLLTNNVNLISYYNQFGIHNRNKFIKYLNRVPLDANGLDELVFKFKFELYDELTPMVRRFINKIHENRVVLLEQGKNINVNLIRHEYLSVPMATRFYHYCKENVYYIQEKEKSFIIWALKLYEPNYNMDYKKGIVKCDSHIIRLALINLHRKILTMQVII